MPNMEQPENDLRQQALQYFHQAYERQMNGELDVAIALYTRSIEAFPTAEAYTFRGWTYCFKEDLNRAIADCLEAIKVDPDFGNPYNDIGAYLIQLGKWDEAIPWLEQATSAKRYESYYFPHFNLGRIYEHKHDWKKARKYYKQAFEMNPQYVIALRALKKLEGKWN